MKLCKKTQILKILTPKSRLYHFPFQVNCFDAPSETANPEVLAAESFILSSISGTNIKQTL